MKLYTAALLTAAALGSTIGFNLPTVPLYTGESCTDTLARHGYYPEAPGVSRAYMSSIDSEYYAILNTCDPVTMTKRQYADAWHWDHMKQEREN